MPPKRSASAVGVFAGIALLIGFNEILELGEALVRNNGTNPWLAMWLPFGIFTAISFQLYYVATRKVGGQPLKLLDAAANLFSAIVKRFSGKSAATS
ncbi:MAG: LptF/LptG family permease [Pseudomonadota bacterium]